ncbi:hypothetical protein AB0M95_12475 [Sphaerisporangium sp. NPDC051017]|uniref:hypothetical protein n=1 Tax=Sphaerisporangium sp. NPDC051017 TaxID=3154636 RepID=UPI00343FB109
MKRVRLRKGGALRALTLTAVLSTSLWVSPPAPAGAAEADGPAAVPSPPLPVATLAGFSGAYRDSADYLGNYQPAAISADGDTIAYTYTPFTTFQSQSVIVNRKTGTSVTLPADGVQLSEDARKAVYVTTCGNSCAKLYVRDLTTGADTRLDVPDGRQENSVYEVSYDGVRTVVYRSRSAQVPGAGLYQWYVRDLVTGDVRTLRDPRAPETVTRWYGHGSAVSPGGRFIAISWLDAAYKAWVSVYDQVTGQYTLVTKVYTGAPSTLTPLGGPSATRRRTARVTSSPGPPPVPVRSTARRSTTCCTDPPARTPSTGSTATT